MFIETDTNRLNKFLSDPLFLVIDMQNVYRLGQEWECHSFENALQNILKLLEYSKIHNVSFTKYIAPNTPTGVWVDYNKEYESINNNKWLNEIVPELDEYTKCGVFSKSTFSALKVPDLKKIINKFSCVIVSGVVADCCVLSTVMDLIDAGKYVIYLTDAISGMSVEADEATIKVLEGLSPLHLSIMTTDALIYCMNHVPDTDSHLSHLDLFNN